MKTIYLTNLTKRLYLETNISSLIVFFFFLFPRHSIGKEVFESFSQRRKLFLNRVFTVKYGATSLGNQLQLTQKQTTKKELCIVPMNE